MIRHLAAAGSLAAALLAPGAAAENVRVRIETSAGDIVVDVDDAAPLTAANFLAHVDQGLYDGARFYRVTRPANDPMIEVVQGGLWDPAREGDPGYAFTAPRPPIAHETTAASGLSHVDGAISMARGEPGTAASEFFITIGPHPELDFGGARNPDGQGFAAFGRVVAGMEVVRAIQTGSTAASLSSPVMAGQILDAPVVIARMRRD